MRRKELKLTNQYPQPFIKALGVTDLALYKLD